jgi:lysophospholipase L1-like esterase
MTSPTPEPAASASAAALPSASPPSAAAPVGVPKGAKVLHLGDSFAGALGLELNAVLEERGAEGVLRFKTASFIPEWAWKGGIPQFMAEHRPDLVLITLGANEVAIREPETRVAVIEKLVKQFGDTPCVWIAIPLWASDTGLMPVIRDHCAPCRFMDSNELRFADGTRVRDMPRLPDKIHPTMRARRQWAEFVVDWLAAERDPVGPRLWSLRGGR